MSFNLVTAMWIAKIFTIYTFMVVILPYFILRRVLKEKTWTQKFVFSVIAGNFFYIMLVLLLGLIHVTNRYVLIIFTLAVPVIMIVRARKVLWEDHCKETMIHIRRFLKRENSFRYSRRIFFRWAGRKIRRGLKKFVRFFVKNFFEIILFVGCSAFIIWFFSITNHFGPRASDLVVHMLWINEVDKGNLFCNGVYPFGMHALLYYIHAVFDIPTVRLVLLFGPVQTFYIFTMLLAFLKEMCRFRYTPYIAYAAYAVGGYIMGMRYSRFYSSLPQEFGMMFIFPCGVALIGLFRAIRDENAEYKKMKKEKLLYTQISEKHRWRESTIWLWLLILSFGLTLSAHFYNTIIAGLLILAGAIAYIRYVIPPRTLRRLICAALISVLIPIFPMGVAFATGTPLEGSLYWALEVMGIYNSEEENSDGEVESGNTVTEEELPAEEVTNNGELMGESQGEEIVPDKIVKPSLAERAKQFVVSAKEGIMSLMQSLIFSSQEYLDIWIMCMVATAGLIPFMWIFREWEYSRFLLMNLLYIGMLALVCAAGRIGLPSLLDENRSSIYLSYSLMVGVSLAVDGALVIGSELLRVRWFWQMASLALAAVFVGNMVTSGEVREKIVNASSLERDGAALCVYDIMEKYPYQKWTIVSCNEERNMISPEAWHYETIDFLESMENYKSRDEMFIPTQYVFFFIEKRSINYALGEFTDDVDAFVSEEWASEDLPAKSGLGQYADTNRIIVNSRMYYWAQEYQRRFPNEMKVYYEDEDFICYCIEQNEYYLNNFAIDYGYNSGGAADD
ncbi:hypothetical protein [Massilistercora timonensis]|uniref:hypothetical protein n=1 Tax=Massilistercora timonensis TaxID=2086584 RepID=UPI003AB42C95